MLLNNNTQLKIIQNIWLNGKVTMLELSRELNIDRSNISRNLKKLMKSGLIIYDFEKAKNHTVGRKSYQIKFNYDFAYNIGVTVTESFILAYLMNLNFKVIKKEILFKMVDEKTIIDDLNYCINLFSSYLDNVLFIVVSFPEPVDHEQGMVLSSGIFPIQDLPLKRILEKKINKLVYLENDANAGVMYHFFQNKGQYQDIVFMFLSFHINEKNIEGIQGNGIIINGELYKGAHGFSGELPLKIKILDQEKTDSLDLLRFQKFVNRKQNSIILEPYVEWYSKIASIIINFLDPEIFIIGGHTEILPKKTLKEMVKKTESKIIDNDRRKIKIIIDENGLESISKGSAMSYMNQIMNDTELVNKIFSKISVNNKYN